jgi:hypothetical protein
MNALAVFAALLGVGSLAACTSESPKPEATPTVTTTTTVTATPAPAAASPDDPIDALGAWTACAVLAQREYVNQQPESELRPYSDEQAPEPNGDGSFHAIVGVTPPPGTPGGIVALCDVGGTRGNPVLTRFAMKDI